MTALQGDEDVGTGTYSLYGRLRKIWTLQEALRRAECLERVCAVTRAALSSGCKNKTSRFTLSRSFPANPSGVFAADLAALDLSGFLEEQRITPGSLSFIFTRSGEIVAYPDQARMAAILLQSGQTMVPPPQLSAPRDPVGAGLFAAYRESSTPGDFDYRVAMSAGLSRSRRATGATSCWGSRCHSTRPSSR
jgi:hypothetical protein